MKGGCVRVGVRVERFGGAMFGDSERAVMMMEIWRTDIYCCLEEVLSGSQVRGEAAEALRHFKT
jgi:hypothetical protein